MRIDIYPGHKDTWADWSFVFKATARSAHQETFQILDWVERQDSPITEEALGEKFVGVNVDKLSGELFDILCTICKGEALAIVRSEEGMQGFQAWHELHLSHTLRIMAQAIMIMVNMVPLPKITLFHN